MKINKCIEYAFSLLKNAYAPYSKFSVASVVVTKKGDCYEGVNIENASYGLTSCAERNALFHAYAKGVKKEEIDFLVIVSSADHIISPCGACRQVLLELLPDDAQIVLSDGKNNKIFNSKQLLPFQFDARDLT